MEGARYLEDGKLTVFRRAGIYYARLRLAGSSKYITRSLKTSNEQTAVDLGRRLLFQLEQRADQGLPPKSKLFTAVIDEYTAYRERDQRHGRTSAGMLRQIVRVSKFWREYAGHLAVEAIDDKVMREFIPWRRDYYRNFEKLPKNAKLHPADKTLQWDMMLGKAIVRWAGEQGLRGKQPVITVTFTPKKKRVRPAFERWEYRLLIQVNLLNRSISGARSPTKIETKDSRQSRAKIPWRIAANNKSPKSNQRNYNDRYYTGNKLTKIQVAEAGTRFLSR